MDDLDQFLRLWLPLTATGTYRVFAWWAGGHGVNNEFAYLPITDDQFEDAVEIRELTEVHDELFVYMATFSKKSTKAKWAEPVPLLWLDLDECNPDDHNPKYFPSLVWETSDSHYQALWRLTTEVALDERKEMNRALYHLYKDFGSDASYDVSRRLRLPGTVNLKPGRDKWRISIAFDSGKTYDPGEMSRAAGVDTDNPIPRLDTPDESLIQLLPRDLVAMMAEIPSMGLRSELLMKILLRLAGMDISAEEMFVLAASAGSNKFKNRPQQLWVEVQKARALQERPPPGFVVTFPTASATREQDSEPESPPDPLAGWRGRSELPADYEMKWQYNPFLPRKSVLLVSGMPGVRKSWLVSDLAISIVLEKPFCGIPPQDPGPVFYVAPDDEQERLSERIHLIEQAHGTEIAKNFYWRQSGVHFGERKWAEKLEAAIVEVRPKLVVFDGIYLMGYNSQDFGSSLPPQLIPLKEMCTTYDTSFVLVHHATRSRKDDGDDPRSAGMGSVLLGAFFTMGWTLENKGVDVQGRQRVQWRIGGKGTPGRPSYRITFGSDTRKYEISVREGVWDEDEATEEEAKQAEF